MWHVIFRHSPAFHHPTYHVTIQMNILYIIHLQYICTIDNHIQVLNQQSNVGYRWEFGRPEVGRKAIHRLRVQLHHLVVGGCIEARATETLVALILTCRAHLNLSSEIPEMSCRL